MLCPPDLLHVVSCIQTSHEFFAPMCDSRGRGRTDTTLWPATSFTHSCSWAVPNTELESPRCLIPHALRGMAFVALIRFHQNETSVLCRYISSPTSLYPLKYLNFGYGAICWLSFPMLSPASRYSLPQRYKSMPACDSFRRSYILGGNRYGESLFSLIRPGYRASMF